MGIIKDAVKRECRKQNLTQVELAEMLGMKAGNLNNQIGRDETVQFSLLKKICEKLAIRVGSLLSEKLPDDNDFENDSDGEQTMIFKQLQKILEDGDDEVVEQIIGKIGMEHMRLTQKKDSSRNRVTNGE